MRNTKDIVAASVVSLLTSDKPNQRKAGVFVLESLRLPCVRRNATPACERQSKGRNNSYSEKSEPFTKT